MAVNIDTVYQRVLAIANKEQRGTITPLEFNIFANQAQMDIFEQYFYDRTQFERRPGNETEYSDMLNILDEKISLFEKSAELTPTLNVGTKSINPYYFKLFSKPDLYRFGSIIWNKYGDDMLLGSGFDTNVGANTVGDYFTTSGNFTIGSSKATKSAGAVGYLNVLPSTEVGGNSAQTLFTGFTQGKKYALTLTITPTSSTGELRFVNNLQTFTNLSTGGVANSFPSGAASSGDFTINEASDGTETQKTLIWIQGPTTPTLLSIWGDADWAGSIDNISVREIHDPIEVSRVSNKEIISIQNLPLVKPTETNPMYTVDNTGFTVYPNTITSGIWCNYINKPIKVNWAYQVVNDSALYNSTNSVDFELHASEETDLVIKILALAGVSLQDPGLYQIASSEDNKNTTQEKQ